MGVTRRDILMNAGKLASGLAIGGAAMNATGEEQTAAAPEKRKLKVVVAGGHPGDPEYGCGGTIARYTDRGDDVVLLYMNNGAWPPTPAPIRVAEAKKASGILGATPAYAGQENGHAIVDNAHYDDFRKVIDGLAPDVMFVPWPIDHHPDHLAMSILALETWLKSGKKYAFYYYEVGEDTMMFQPTDFVDITAQLARKREACYAHASQTPDYWYPLQIQLSDFRGAQSGYKSAEGFTRHWMSHGNMLP